MKEIEYQKICFVAMPFGIKDIDSRKIDFDYIYERIFRRGIEATPLPEGGYLIAKRTDQDFFSGSIDLEMFRYLEYSRITVADVSGLNANVMYELGVRHRANQSGTVIFRQVETNLPFDINHIKAFPYEYDPEEQLEASCVLVTKILAESLEYNRLDSPVQLALTIQRTLPISIDNLLKDAENAIRNKDIRRAIGKYREAIQIDLSNPTLHLEVGLLYKDEGAWEEAEEAFSKAISRAPTYSDAHRELGIAQNKIYCRPSSNPTVPTGEYPLIKAISLNSEDFDAYASLGGIYKRLRRYDEALNMYQQSTYVSRGHPYPLLNEIRLQVHRDCLAQFSPKQTIQMSKAERLRKGHAVNNPPIDAPWCFFDLADIYLYKNEADTFLYFLQEGIYSSRDIWPLESHLSSLNLIEEAFGDQLPYQQGIELLKNAIDNF
ncbi:hypothetical protein LC612_40865 [Nostoc sp. CHAB 5834]|nr:hypothetical protein [Nostoc sp. CHAB 5834]